MNRSKMLIGTARLAVVAGLATVLCAASLASAQGKVLACSGAQYIWDPSGPPSVYVNRVWSVLSLVNRDPATPVAIDRILVYDRNGKVLCDFGPGRPLPVKAFDPPVIFDFTRPLGPYEALNLTTTVATCIPWPAALSDNVLGTLTFLVDWSHGRGRKGAPLQGQVVTFVQEIQSSLITSRSSTACEDQATR
jgi:hypothetical protein